MSEPIRAAGAPDIRIQGNPVHFFVDLSLEEMSAAVQYYMDETRRCYDSIAASISSPSWETTLAPFSDEKRCCLGEIIQSIMFTSMVTQDKAFRDLSYSLRERIQEFDIEMLLRTDVYKALKALRDSPEYDKLDDEAKKLLEQAIQSRIRSGLDLPAEERDQARELMTKISTLESKYNQFVQEQNPELLLTAEQLAGVPASSLATMQRDKDGNYIVRPKEYPHCFPIGRYCTVRETRELVQRTRGKIGIPENTARLAEIVNLRTELARRLGFQTHAENVLWENMIKSGEEARAFLTGIRQKLMAPAASERREILQMLGITDPDALVPVQDAAFCQRRIEEERYSIDSEAVRQYLPTEIVVPRVIQLLCGVLGLHAVKVGTHALEHRSKDQQRSIQELVEGTDYSLVHEENGEIIVDTWHKDVMAYRVTDAQTGDLHGFLLLDIYPRAGTYSHACCDCIVTPCRHYGKGGKPVVRPAVAALLCNFTPPTEDAPSLLEHDELCTLLHECGHAMHVLSSRTRYKGTSSFCIEQDAVELPSQAFEGFGWLHGSLKVLSHHKTTGEPLPDDMIDLIVRSRCANKGLLEMRQVQLGLLDNTLHTRRSQDGDITSDDIIELDQRLQRDVTGYSPLPGVSLTGNFGHLVGGYDARYYGYLYSNVASCDCFATLVERAGGDITAGNLDEYIAHFTKAGLEFRKELLAVGASRDARESIRRYLGRDAEPDALLRTWGFGE